MARIRVNTEDLQNKAKDFDSAAEAFKRAGDDILAAAMSMPSYDGQLSGPARKMGYEFQKQARELSAALTSDAESLRKTAQAFEEVDNQAINAFEKNQEMLLSNKNTILLGIDQGDSYLGYRDDGLSPTVILCMYGICCEVTRAGNEAAIAEFEAAVDNYLAHEILKNKIEDDINKAIIIGSLSTLGGSIAGGIPGVIAGMTTATTVAFLVKQLYEVEALMVKDTEAAAYYWNVLIGSKGLGPCMTGDDNQSQPNATRGGEIYQP
jgi:type VII secretion effector (TIGR04197 family)